MSHSSVCYLDTSVLLPMLDKGNYIVSRDESRSISGFRYNLEHNNVDVRTSFVVLGELLNEVLEKCSREQYQDITYELLSFSKHLHGGLKCCPEKFRDKNQEFYKTLEALLNADDRLRDSPTDALILSIATLDPESGIFYTKDSSMLFSKTIKDVVNETRTSLGLKPLKISSVPEVRVKRTAKKQRRGDT